MMPTPDPLAMMLGIVLALGVVFSLLFDVIIWLALWRRKLAPSFAFTVGTIQFFVFAGLIAYRLSVRDLLPDEMVAFFFIPLPLGLLTMFAALMSSRRSGALSPVRVGLTLLGLALMGHIAVTWRAMSQRGAQYDAVLHEDVAETRRLIAAKAGGDAKDAAFRQEQLIHAARDANPELVAAMLDGGADPNGIWDDWRPLVAAISADPILRLHPVDRATHDRNRRTTVRLLLDHGANPSGPRTKDRPTPAEAAWGGNDLDIVELLKARGASDAERVKHRFDDLINAATEGNVERVRSILAESSFNTQRDAQRRSPLIVAAANGHAAVVSVLLQHYGGMVKCDLVSDAMKAADDAHHIDIHNQLAKLCS